MAIDLDKIAAGVNPSGISPEIEKKADEYGRRAWTMDVQPILTKVLGDQLTPELEAEFQQALFNHKVAVLEASEDKKETLVKLGKRW